MARAEHPFRAWLCQLTGPLNRHESRVVIGALIHCLRNLDPVVSRRWKAFFYRHWTPNLLLDDELETIMQRVRQPYKLGRPALPNQLRERYNDLLDLAELLLARKPGLTEFRRELTNWQEIGVCPKGKVPLPMLRLYRLHENPKRLVLTLLSATTGKSVKYIRERIKDRLPSAPPAP